MTARATFRQSDLDRAMKAAKAEGKAVVIESGTIRLEPYKPPPPTGPCVYVIRISGFDLVKIGYSTDVPRRLAELAAGAGMGGGLVEVARFRGDIRAEKSLHARFAGQRLFGEWFRLSGPVSDWLSSLSVEVPE